MSKLETIIPVDDHITIRIDDTMGCMEDKFRARTVDPVGFGSGDTPAEAARSLVRCIRASADTMEASIDEWENIQKEQRLTSPARFNPGHCNRCGCDIEGNKAGHELRIVKVDNSEAKHELCRSCIDELTKEGRKIEFFGAIVY